MSLPAKAGEKTIEEYKKAIIALEIENKQLKQELSEKKEKLAHLQLSTERTVDKIEKMFDMRLEESETRSLKQSGMNKQAAMWQMTIEQQFREAFEEDQLTIQRLTDENEHLRQETFINLSVKALKLEVQ